jgi:pyruvate-formate lyase-activating enzyme
MWFLSKLTIRSSIIKLSNILFTSLFIITTAAYAGEADVIKVDVKRTGDDTYFFKVTVRHEDEGWDHYANKWDVVAPDGTILGTRTLYHPHVDEQPFTRSLSDVKISESITEVTIRAHDSVHEYGGKTMSVAIPR